MSTMNWFEIPTADFDRAAAFYGAVLAAPLKKEVFGGVPHAVFAGGGGALVKDGRSPSDDGALVYFNAVDERTLEAMMARVAVAGGQLLGDKTSLGPHGWCAMLRDSEGNRVALHAPV